ncbi:hypothetical protein T310_8125 [Rasamsonia emersonii CBS 393.64]|uniref:Uncharacterized protein n=1 Tax=Rasamsonia emersonii (strain ATCC 16479 / CBS 393.64 / IMI 116815) TaxID=1408163 RepID=A0A0F4YI17_RASE3|nr:hypothetical protein T310_8125 [Rasamsonia emersonii CBS 393.64]KKA17932.1 hypothetical protein T310_8125 [Rasamsonia emersonii CBS 393.64]
MSAVCVSLARPSVTMARMAATGKRLFDSNLRLDSTRLASPRLQSILGLPRQVVGHSLLATNQPTATPAASPGGRESSRIRDSLARLPASPCVTGLMRLSESTRLRAASIKQGFDRETGVVIAMLPTEYTSRLIALFPVFVNNILAKSTSLNRQYQVSDDLSGLRMNDLSIQFSAVQLISFPAPIILSAQPASLPAAHSKAKHTYDV